MTAEDRFTSTARNCEEREIAVREVLRNKLSIQEELNKK
jgi:hypothetical protein